MKKIILTILTTCLVAGVAASAQPSQGRGPQQGDRKTGEQISSKDAAKRLTEEMTRTLGLDGKQQKKAEKFNQWDQREMESMMQHNRPQGMPGGQPPMGGGPGMGGGRPPMGGGMQPPSGNPQMGGPNGGRPQMGGGPQDGQFEGGMPGGRPDNGQMEQHWNKKEKKLKKFLTPEQFSKWYGLHPEHFGVERKPSVDNHRNGK